MTVLFLSQIVPYPPHGGVLQRGYNIIRELAKRARVHLLAFVHPDVLPTKAAQDESQRHLLDFCVSVEYFRLWPKISRGHTAVALGVSLVSSQPFSVIGHRSRAFEARVINRIRQSSIDLVHVDTIALAPFVPDRCTLPKVLTHHNIESNLMERRGLVERRKLAQAFLLRESAKLRAYERAISPTFDVNIVMSAEDESALRGLAPSVRTAIVPNGVDINYFSPDPSGETPALIYTGGMNMFANRDAVLYFLKDIWPLIVRERSDVRFFAVGQDPPLEVKVLAERDPRIQVTGFVRDVRPLVRQSSVYVVPLRVGGGTRLKVLDAMASGKALVSTSVGCEGLSVRDGKHLIVADSPEAFANATLALLQSPERRRALGTSARQLVEHRYAWSTVGDRLFEAYEQARLWKEHVA